jgi:ribosomal protein L37AE/L43A
MEVLMPEDAMNGAAADTNADEALAQRGAALSTQLVRHGAEPAGLAAAPQVSAAQLVERLDVIRQAMRTAMDEGVDYGRVPGSEKPGLFKPGAEKLSVLFQLDVQPRNELIWGPGDHLTVISRATVYHGPTGARLGYGEGICSTRERKYAYRRADRRCPECGKPTVLKSRDPGGGWFCWRRKGGCGAKFPDGDERIERQPQGEIENPDLPDTWNTVDKMAKKRAYVDATLSVTGASAIFTQDIAADESEPAGNPAHGPVIEAALKPEATRAAIRLCGGDVDGARALWRQIQSAHEGYMPRAAAAALIHAAAALPQPVADATTGKAAQSERKEVRSNRRDGDEVIGVEFATLEPPEAP